MQGSCIDGVMVSMLTLSAVDLGFEPPSDQRLYKIGICCFSVLSKQLNILIHLIIYRFKYDTNIKMHFVGFVKELDMALLTVFEIRLSNLLARKFQNYNIYIDSIEKIWQKSLVRINFHWPWATGPLLKSKTGLKLIRFLVLKVYCKSKV
jgi:hypothetical protein